MGLALEALDDVLLRVVARAAPGLLGRPVGGELGRVPVGVGGRRQNTGRPLGGSDDLLSFVLGGLLVERTGNERQRQRCQRWRALQHTQYTRGTGQPTQHTDTARPATPGRTIIAPLCG